MDKLYKDREWFRRYWVELGTKTGDMADLAGVSSSTITVWRKKLGFDPRGPCHSEATKKKIGVSQRAAWTEERRQRMIDWNSEFWTEEQRKENGRAWRASLTPEYSRQLSARNRLMWTTERRKKLSDRNLVRWADPDERKKQSDTLKAYYAPEERRAVISERMKKFWMSGVYDGVFCSPTSIELNTEEALTDLNFVYVSQYRPEGYTRFYDFYLPDLKVTVECQGEYWHDDSCFPGIAIRDEEKKQWAIENGYFPLELWGDDIRKYGAKLLLVEELVSEGIL